MDLKKGSDPKIMMKEDRGISRCLPEFVPISKDPSDIIDSKMRAQIAKFMPALVRMREWKLLFTTAIDGISYNTFYANLKDRDNTVLLAKDTKGKVFGAYCSEAWHKTLHFYGLGESFVFTFNEKKEIQIYSYTGMNEKIQFSNEKCIILGGGCASSQKSEAAIYIGVDFQKGHSGESETFDNKLLSSQRDFVLINFEVWGFDSI